LSISKQSPSRIWFTVTSAGYTKVFNAYKVETFLERGTADRARAIGI
jgi:hypothetical protein